MQLRNRGTRVGFPDHFVGIPRASYARETPAVEHHLAHLFSAYYVSTIQRASLPLSMVVAISPCRLVTAVRGRVSTLGRSIRHIHLGSFIKRYRSIFVPPHEGDDTVSGTGALCQPRVPWMRCESWWSCVRIAGTSSRGAVRSTSPEIEEDPMWIMENHPDLETCSSEARGTARPPSGPRRALTEQSHISHVRAGYYETLPFISQICKRKPHIADVALAGGVWRIPLPMEGTARNGSDASMGQAAAGDAGGAIARLSPAWHKLGGKSELCHGACYWAPAFSAAEVEQLLRQQRAEIVAAEGQMRAIRRGELCRVSLQQSPMGRSSLVPGPMMGAAAHSAILDLVRSKAGGHEGFAEREDQAKESHFAIWSPSGIGDAVARWLRGLCVPFMIHLSATAEEQRTQIPAVNPRRRIGRLQTVSRRQNPRTTD